MKYLLDTDAFSDIVRGTPNVEAHFLSIPPAAEAASTSATEFS